MKVETIGKVLIAAGMIILLYAMSMPVSRGGSGIVNIHLISERQNTLLFGGLLFIAGIILFAVFKLKQTKEEGDLADKLKQERTDAVKSILTETNHGPQSTVVRLAIGITFGAYSAFFLTQTALFVVAMMTEEFVPKGVEWIVTGVITLALIAFAFRKVSIQTLMIPFVVLAVLATVSIPVRIMLHGFASGDCERYLAVVASDRVETQTWGKLAFCANLFAR